MRQFFSPPRHLAISRGVLDCQNVCVCVVGEVWRCYWSFVYREARDAVKQTSVYQTAPPAKNFLVPNVSSTKDKKPCSRLMQKFPEDFINLVGQTRCSNKKRSSCVQCCHVLLSSLNLNLAGSRSSLLPLQRNVVTMWDITSAPARRD